jgi:predicted MPP superfamily phosphohydrolase
VGKIPIIFWLLVGHVAIWVTLYNRLHSMGIPRRLVVIGSGIAVAFLLGMPLMGGWLLVQGGLRERLLDLPFPSLLAGSGNRWGLFPLEGKALSWGHWAAVAYLGLCGVQALWVLVRWIWLRIPRSVPGVRRVVRQSCDPPRAAIIDGDSTPLNRWLLRLAGNESLHLELTQVELEIPRLPRALDGVRVVHLSDLHLSGRVPRRYFEYVVSVVNGQEPDFVFLTGDIVEKERCLPWAKEVFSEFRARYGCYFVFGNHELRLDVGKSRKVLEQAGLVDLGGRIVEVPMLGPPQAEFPPKEASSVFRDQLFLAGVTAPGGFGRGLGGSEKQTREGKEKTSRSGESGEAGRNSGWCSEPISRESPLVGFGHRHGGWQHATIWTDNQNAYIPPASKNNVPRVILVGNERPWFPELPRVEEVNGWDSPGSFRIALSHTPDQIVWARAVGIDLLLAGHLHGGQIRLPGIGPIVSPSKFGVRYNAGLFFLPPTLLYVNRGLSARLPLRWNSKPEVASLILRSGVGGY